MCAKRFTAIFYRLWSASRPVCLHKFSQSPLTGGVIHIYGDGEQTRDFTFYTEAVQANIARMTPHPGGLYNIAVDRGYDKQVLALLETNHRITPKVSLMKAVKKAMYAIRMPIPPVKIRSGYEPQLKLQKDCG